ncbi:MAG: cation:dicarboxylase symporter family transporter, partial [Gallionella sp.]|nr:cation:dicarboxylase symporter family transporter [Gallionella sp.]
MIKLKLHWQILIALLLAVIAGTLAGTDSALFGVTFYAVFDFIGTLFLNALKMLIVPLVVSPIIVGIAGIAYWTGVEPRLILENAVRKFHKTDQDVIGFRGCEFIRTEHVDCANEFAPTRSSTAVFR